MPAWLVEMPPFDDFTTLVFRTNTIWSTPLIIRAKKSQSHLEFGVTERRLRKFRRKGMRSCFWDNFQKTKKNENNSRNGCRFAVMVDCQSSHLWNLPSWWHLMEQKKSVRFENYDENPSAKRRKENDNSGRASANRSGLTPCRGRVPDESLNTLNWPRKTGLFMNTDGCTGTCKKRKKRCQQRKHINNGSLRYPIHCIYITMDRFLLSQRRLPLDLCEPFLVGKGIRPKPFTIFYSLLFVLRSSFVFSCFAFS